jgi:hypothetical protein
MCDEAFVCFLERRSILRSHLSRKLQYWGSNESHPFTPARRISHKIPGFVNNTGGSITFNVCVTVAYIRLAAFHDQ